MGKLGKLLSFVRSAINGAKNSDVKADPGGSANVTAQHFESPGSDSVPLPGDYVCLIQLISTGRYGAVGYVDPKNEQKSEAGEKRFYSRNNSGVEMAQLWLKRDGTIRGNNNNGFFELNAAGVFNVNGVTIDAAGNINSPTSMAAPSIKAANKELAGHNHQVTTAPGVTGPNQ